MPAADESPLAWLDRFDEYEQLCRVRLEHVVPVREPLVVVSQLPRSGGTLFSQLLDGHPEVHAHPTELKIGHPKIWQWPQIDLAQPESWFPTLFEKKVVTHLTRGYRKSPKKRDDREVFPFAFLPVLQRRIFERLVTERSPATERDVLDCYFTSYFNAWVDNQNLWTGPKRAVSAFWPRFITSAGAAEHFFAAYPDGLLVSVVRDPRGWFASARRWLRKYEQELEPGVERWRRSTLAALEAHDRFGERVLLVVYEDAVADIEETMRLLAARAGISWAPSLLEPTFNGRPIRANSSGATSRGGVLPERAEAWRDELDAATAARIEGLAGDLYDQAAERARAAAKQTHA